MKKPRIVIPDWLLGGVLTAVILLLFLFPFGPWEAMEARLYDWGVRLRQPAEVAQNIADLRPVIPLVRKDRLAEKSG